MIYHRLELRITDRCNAACASCGLRCSPSGERIMSLTLAKRLIDEARALDFDTIVVAGGEPFLYPDLLFDVLEYAKKAGFKAIEVKTNGFWGGWEEEKRNGAAERLKECVTDVFIGYDSFHAEYIPAESVWNAARTLQSHRIDFAIAVADVNGEKGAGPFLASLGVKGMNKYYRIYPLEPFGNAATLPPEMFIAPFLPKGDPCAAIGADGTVYPDHSPAAVEAGLILGNAADAPLSEILAERLSGKNGGDR